MLDEEDQYIIDKRIEKAQEFLNGSSQFISGSGLQPTIYPIGGNYTDLISTIRIDGCINVEDLSELYKILKGQDNV